LGDTLELSQPQVQTATQFVCTLYGDSKGESLDALRCAKADKGIAAKRLPPTENSFALHLLRCVYQVFIWKHAHIAMCAVPAPTQFGYEKGEGELQPKMMTQTAAAPELLNDIVCDCSDDCLSNCSCFQNNQPCTTACPCDAKDSCLNALTLETLITMMQYETDRCGMLHV
jgi:hypothetical protein